MARPRSRRRTPQQLEELSSPEDPRGRSTAATGQYYLHCFLPEQPDLDWSNPEVEEAMREVVRFWLDRGIDGFRIDVVHLIGKDPALADHPPERAEWPHVVLNDHDSDPRAPPSPPAPGRLLLR